MPPVALVLRVRRLGVPAALALACLAAAALSLLLPSTPTYDPWAWIVWGREIAELDLNTESGPSWKPLPILFTTLFSPFGDAAPDLWLVVARAAALVALVITFRLTWRLAGRGVLGAFAGGVAVVGLFLSTRWIRVSAVGNSEGLLVALALSAIERHVAGARTQAFALGVGAALLRPEVWPFLALYALYVWRAEPERRRLITALLLLVPALWLGPELWGSGDPLRASSRAREPNPGSPAFADRPALEVLHLAADFVITPIEVGFGIGLVLAAAAFVRRREQAAVLAAALIALAWVAIVAVMTEAGYAGNPRYLILAGALACVVAGAGWARLVRAVAGFLTDRLHAGAGKATGLRVVLALAVVAAAAPLSLEPVHALPDQLDALRDEAELYDDLDEAVRRAGGRERALDCGRPYTGPYQIPALAWQLHVHLDEIEFEDLQAPGIVFRRRGARGPVPEAGTGFRAVGSTRRWEIFAACGPGGRVAGA